MDMSQFAYALYKQFNIQKLGLTRHSLFPVSPGMCPYFYCGKYSFSIFNISTSEQTEKSIKSNN